MNKSLSVVGYHGLISDPKITIICINLLLCSETLLLQVGKRTILEATIFNCKIITVLLFNKKVKTEIVR